MDESVANVVIVNTHPGENPEFVGQLKSFLASLDIEPQVVEGYEGVSPLDRNPQRIILTGVPMSASYSLAEAKTQKVIDRAFGWLWGCKRPVLGICFGHQILAHVFGGKVSSLEAAVQDERYPLALETGEEGGVFSGIQELEVFAEHRDYVSVVPQGFRVLCRKNGVPYIMYHPGRELYGVQFVPELSDDRSKNVLKRFIER